ncbi:MAG: hypothetical protein HYS17_07990 [Micavibrio aeruginosavorus]|uniref:Uncharacterized protein n=1 Tax=Micavibrio aeruginosavorus TaxID=349221 RepID=A0A7T5UG39_9BACT|nr:MAG: hypothetical protein HYS17_07990 [Micavibrio aeruginosavorus]
MDFEVRPIVSLSLKELWELREDQGEKTAPAILKAIADKEAALAASTGEAPTVHQQPAPTGTAHLPPKPVC